MNPNDPNIVSLVIDSIIDHSEDWTIELVGGDPTIHTHKSGIGIWAYLSSDKVKFWKPEYAKTIQITKADRILLFNTIEKDRIEKQKNIREKATKRLLKQFTKPSYFRKLFG